MPRPVVFVSYSHKDEKEKDALLTHLGVLQQDGQIDLWGDDRIRGGGDWKAEIARAIRKSSVAILLITANFLTSEFILAKEVPQLLKRRQSRGLIVFPVIARDCAWQKVEWLAEINVRPKNGRPVWGDGGSHVDEDLAAIAKEVADIVADIVEKAKKAAASKVMRVAPPGSGSGQTQPANVPTELDGWWRKRGYKSNPFIWDNAADVSRGRLPELFLLWHIDPARPADSQGLGGAPTLDKVMSLETSQLATIYAPEGGGKTFYRRWAAEQITEQKDSSKHALEIPNLLDLMPNPQSITACDLALCVYESICKQFSTQEPLPNEQHVLHILRQCDEMVQPYGHVYVFIDDIEPLFEEQPSGAKQNARALKAIVDFCKAAAGRGGGEPLALRLFIPERLKGPIQKGLGRRNRLRIREHTILWRAEHCQAVIERRLDSCWDKGPDTGTVHLSRLLARDALDEFRKWLKRQKSLSPRYVILVLNRLVDYANNLGVTTGLIGIEIWHKFWGSDESKVLAI